MRALLIISYSLTAAFMALLGLFLIDYGNIIGGTLSLCIASICLVEAAEIWREK